MVKIPDIQFANTALDANTAFQTPTQADTGSAKFAGAVFAGLDEASQRIRSREDTVNRIRTVDKFKQDAFDNFTRSQMEMDLTDPETVKTFNQQMRQKAADYLKNFKGSPDARVQVESEIGNILTTYTTQMTANSITAQRQFVMSKAGEQINAISQEVRKNPSMINEAFLKGEAIIQDIAPAIYAEDENSLKEAMRAQISIGAVEALIENGEYEKANEFVTQDVSILETIPPQKQIDLKNRIDVGLQEKAKVQDEINKKKQILQLGEELTGVKVDPMQKLQFITGANFQQSPDAVINDIAKTYGIKPEEVPPELQLRVKYPELKAFEKQEVDPNKDYGPDNKLTVTGIKKEVEKPIKAVQTLKSQTLMLETAINEFRTTGNKAATQAAIVAFKKILDPTSAVMEGEVRMQGEAESLSGRFETLINVGQALSENQVNEIEAVARAFTDKFVQEKKRQVDPLLIDADERGFRRVDINVPEKMYKDLFGTEQLGDIDAPPASDELKNLSDEELQKLLSEMGE